MTTHTTFEDRLLDRLRSVVAANPAPPSSRLPDWRSLLPTCRVLAVMRQADEFAVEDDLAAGRVSWSSASSGTSPKRCGAGWTRCDQRDRRVRQRPRVLRSWRPGARQRHK
jgi:hypothetical protein